MLCTHHPICLCESLFHSPSYISAECIFCVVIRDDIGVIKSVVYIKQQPTFAMRSCLIPMSYIDTHAYMGHWIQVIACHRMRCSLCR